MLTDDSIQCCITRGAHYGYYRAQVGLRVSLTNEKYAAILLTFFVPQKKASKASAPKMELVDDVFKIAFSMKRLRNAQTNLWLPKPDADVAYIEPATTTD